MKQHNRYVSLEGALVCVGAGWADLVRRFYNAREALGTTVGVMQVKEKYGGLRIYTDYMHDELDEIITELERESFTICEECGEPGQLRTGSWYRTLCDIHANGRPAADPF